jgi:hypothetical protein
VYATARGGRDVASNLSAHNPGEDHFMVEEFEREYAPLKDKVRELREYL